MPSDSDSEDGSSPAALRMKEKLAEQKKKKKIKSNKSISSQRLPSSGSDASGEEDARSPKSPRKSPKKTAENIKAKIIPIQAKATHEPSSPGMDLKNRLKNSAKLKEGGELSASQIVRGDSFALVGDDDTYVVGADGSNPYFSDGNGGGSGKDAGKKSSPKPKAKPKPPAAKAPPRKEAPRPKPKMKPALKVTHSVQPGVDGGDGQAPKANPASKPKKSVKIKEPTQVLSVREMEEKLGLTWDEEADGEDRPDIREYLRNLHVKEKHIAAIVSRGTGAISGEVLKDLVLKGANISRIKQGFFKGSGDDNIPGMNSKAAIALASAGTAGVSALLMKSGFDPNMVDSIIGSGPAGLAGDVLSELEGKGIDIAAVRLGLSGGIPQPKVSADSAKDLAGDMAGMGVSSLGDLLQSKGLSQKATSEILLHGQRAFKGTVLKEMKELDINISGIKLGLLASGGSGVPPDIGDLLMKKRLGWSTSVRVMTEGMDALASDEVRGALEEVGINAAEIQSVIKKVPIKEIGPVADKLGKAKGVMDKMGLGGMDLPGNLPDLSQFSGGVDVSGLDPSSIDVSQLGNVDMSAINARNIGAGISQIGNLLRSKGVSSDTVANILMDGHGCLKNRNVMKELQKVGLSPDVVKIGLLSRGNVEMAALGELLTQNGVGEKMALKLMSRGTDALKDTAVLKSLEAAGIDIGSVQGWMDEGLGDSLRMYAGKAFGIKKWLEKLHIDIDIDLPSVDMEDVKEYAKIGWRRLSVAMCLRPTYADNVLKVHVVARTGLRFELESIIREEPHKLEITDSEGRAPVHYAVQATSLSCLKFLLDEGADMDKSCQLGQTPLHYAVLYQNFPAVGELVRRGCDVDATTYSGKSAVEMAVDGKKKRCLAALVEAGAHVPPFLTDKVNHLWPDGSGSLGSTGISSGTNGDGESPDELGTQVYADALGMLVSHPQSTLPLSVGLYGHAGSGKTFLLNKLRRIVMELNHMELIQEFFIKYGIRACERCIQPSTSKRAVAGLNDLPPSKSPLMLLMEGLEKVHHKITMGFLKLGKARYPIAILLSWFTIPIYLMALLLEVVNVNEDTRLGMKLKNLHLKVLYQAWNRRLFKHKAELRRNDTVVCRCKLFCDGGRVRPIDVYITHQRHAFALGKRGARKLPPLPKMHKNLTQMLRYAWIFRFFRSTTIAVAVMTCMQIFDLVKGPIWKIVGGFVYGFLGPLIFLGLLVRDLVLRSLQVWKRKFEWIFVMFLPTFIPPVEQVKPRRFKAVLFNPSLYKDHTKVWAAMLSQIYLAAEENLGEDTIRAERLKMTVKLDRKTVMLLIWPLLLPVVFIVLAVFLWQLIAAGTLSSISLSNLGGSLGGLGAIGAVVASLAGVGGVIVAMAVKLFKGAKNVMATPSSALEKQVNPRKAVSEHVGLLQHVAKELDFFAEIAHKHNLVFWILIDDLEKSEGSVALETLKAINKLITNRRGKPFVVVIVTDPQAVETKIVDYVKRSEGDSVAGNLFLQNALQIHLNMRSPGSSAAQGFLVRMLPRPSKNKTGASGDKKALTAAEKAKARSTAMDENLGASSDDDAVNESARDRPVASKQKSNMPMPMKRKNRSAATEDGVPLLPPAQTGLRSRPGTAKKGNPDASMAIASAKAGSKLQPQAQGRMDDAMSHFTRSEKMFFQEISDFLIPNPRRVRQVFNTYWIVRAVESDIKEDDKRKKLISMVVAANQWPYRLSWVLQYVEDTLQANPGLRKELEFLETPLSSAYSSIKHIMFPNELIPLAINDADPDLFEALLDSDIFTVTMGDIADGSMKPHNLDSRVRNAIEKYSARVQEYPLWSIEDEDPVEEVVETSLRYMTKKESTSPEEDRNIQEAVAEWSTKLRAKMLYTAGDVRQALLDPTVLPEFLQIIPSMMLSTFFRLMLGSMKKDAGARANDNTGNGGGNASAAPAQRNSSAPPGALSAGPKPDKTVDYLVSSKMTVEQLVNMATDSLGRPRLSGDKIKKILNGFSDNWIDTVGHMREADVAVVERLTSDWPTALRRKTVTLLQASKDDQAVSQTLR